MKQGYIVKATVYIGPDGISSKLRDVGLFEDKESAEQLAEDWQGNTYRAFLPPEKIHPKTKSKKNKRDNQSWMRG